MINCYHSFEECNCNCHTTPGMVHCMPCCSTCPHCQKHINFLYYDDHVAKCGQSIRQLACTTTTSELCDCEYHQSPARCHPPCCKICPHCKLHIKETFYSRHLELCQAKK